MRMITETWQWCWWWWCCCWWQPHDNDIVIIQDKDTHTHRLFSSGWLIGIFAEAISCSQSMIRVSELVSINSRTLKEANQCDPRSSIEKSISPNFIQCQFHHILQRMFPSLPACTGKISSLFVPISSLEVLTLCVTSRWPSGPKKDARGVMVNTLDDRYARHLIMDNTGHL